MNNYKKITIDSYNKTAIQYNRAVADFVVLSSLEDFISLLKIGDHILDLGCGPGHHSKIFVKDGFKVTGIDLSPEMVKIAEREVLQANFEVMDITNMKFKANTFDGIWASASLIHLSKAELLDVFKNLENYLVDKGILYMSFKEGIGEEIFTDYRYDNIQKFYAYYSLEELEILLSNTNFKIIKSYVSEKRPAYDTNQWIHIFCVKK